MHQRTRATPDECVSGRSCWQVKARSLQQELRRRATVVQQETNDAHHTTPLRTATAPQAQERTHLDGKRVGVLGRQQIVQTQHARWQRLPAQVRHQLALRHCGPSNKHAISVRMSTQFPDRLDVEQLTCVLARAAGHKRATVRVQQHVRARQIRIAVPANRKTRSRIRKQAFCADVLQTRHLEQARGASQNAPEALDGLALHADRARPASSSQTPTEHDLLRRAAFRQRRAHFSLSGARRSMSVNARRISDSGNSVSNRRITPDKQGR